MLMWFKFAGTFTASLIVGRPLDWERMCAGFLSLDKGLTSPNLFALLESDSFFSALVFCGMFKCYIFFKFSDCNWKKSFEE